MRSVPGKSSAKKPTGYHIKPILWKYIAVICLVLISSYTTKDSYAKEAERRYIFVDGGAHLGEALLEFKTTNLYKQYKWDIFAIEANPAMIKKLEEIPGINIINKAIWIEDGEISFNVEGGMSSIYDDPRFIEPVKITIPCFDFGQWLERNFHTDDYIIVSFDIQGAEMDVLHKMISDNTIRYIDRLYVEFHPFKKEHHEIMREIREKSSELDFLKAEDSAEDVIEKKDGEWVDYIEDK